MSRLVNKLMQYVNFSILSSVKMPSLRVGQPSMCTADVPPNDSNFS